MAHDFKSGQEVYFRTHDVNGNLMAYGAGIYVEQHSGNSSIAIISHGHSYHHVHVEGKYGDIIRPLTKLDTLLNGEE